MKQLKNFSGAPSDLTDSELMDGVMSKYKDKTEEELTEQLLKAAQMAKEDGSFDEQSLQNFVELVSPHLTEAQRQKLYNLISVIKLEG